MKTWNTRYLPPDPNVWQGRAGMPPASCFFQIVQMVNLLKDKLVDATQPTFAFLGFRSDEGIRRNVGRIGAAEGPASVRQSLAKLPLQKKVTCLDVGNIVCADGDLETSQQALGEVVAILLQHHITPIVLGGGHELAWGHYQGIADIFSEKHLGIINFDSHFDMRPLLPDNKGSSGTPFLQIAEAHKKSNRRFDYNCVGIQHAGNMLSLFETAKQYHTKIIFADELHQGFHEKCEDFIERIFDENEILYLSLCLDVFASAFAPGVSAPQPLGLTPWQVIPMVRQLASSGKVISYDIAELSPRYDIDHHTAKLAANLIFEIIHHHSEKNHENNSTRSDSSH